MDPELIICIPGPWNDRKDFLQRIITLEPMGRYMFAGQILADLQAQDHVPIDCDCADENMVEAFAFAGQGKLTAELLAQVAKHHSVAYLHFPLYIMDQRERILKYTQVIQRIGGIAVKLESAGVAHSWESWFGLLGGTPFEVYCAAVTLIGDESYYYSCGMHHFGLPECEVSRLIPVAEAADLMNRFNFWQISERPTISTRHTFSLTPEAPHFRLLLRNDERHESESLFHNQFGIWSLNPK